MGVREGVTGPGGEEMAPVTCAAGCARAVGMGWALSPWVGSGGLPWVFGSSLR